MTVPVGEQDSDRGRFQVQGTDNTRFKVHSRAGGVHGRDKRMLEVQDNNKSNLTCSAVEAHCGATTRLEVYGSVRTRININTRTRKGLRCTAVSLHGKAVTILSPWQCKNRAEDIVTRGETYSSGTAVKRLELVQVRGVQQFQ